MEKLLGNNFLKKHQNHPYNLWTRKTEESKERLLLQRLESYVQVISDSNKKSIRNKLRGGDLSKGLNSQFVDTFYELEIGYSLIEHGLDVDFNHRITGKTKTVKTPDIFLINEKTILEVKTLHQSEKINSGINSGNVFKIFEIERIAERIKHDLEKYSKLEINNPLIIILCNDYLINPTILSADDLEAFLLARADEVFVFGKEHVITGHREYSGFFYQDDGKIARGLSGVGLWSKKLIGFYENPNVKTQSKIPQGKFLEFLTNV